MRDSPIEERGNVIGPATGRGVLALLIKPKLVIPVAALLLGAIVLGVSAAVNARHGVAGSRITGTELDRPTPDIPLLNKDGKQVALADFRGKVVVLSPVLTLCHEVCPLTTGAFIAMEHAVRKAGLADRVVFAEISVDPWRDSPARLRAFARYTGIHLMLLTGTEQNLRRLWRFFGVGYFTTAQGTPPDIDWWTHKPETFDVAHSDGLFILDRRGHLRIVSLGMPKVHGRLALQLRRLLNAKGLGNLAHPDVPWTVSQALTDLSSLLRRRIPQ